MLSIIRAPKSKLIYLCKKQLLKRNYRNVNLFKGLSSIEELLPNVALDHKEKLIVYDIGAHNGKWALTWIKNYPNSKVFLFEANSIFNSQLAKIGKVYNVVLSNESKKVNFYSINGTGDSYYKENSAFYNNITPVERQTSSLDELVNSENLPLPKIIKVDTQGSELDILLGSRVTIRNALYIIIECRLVTSQNMNAPTVSEVIQALAQLNFAPFKILEIHKNKHGILVEIDIVFKNGFVYEDKQ